MIRKKNAAISSKKDWYGEDLERNQELVRKHEEFDTELGNVYTQVNGVVEEYKRLTKEIHSNAAAIQSIEIKGDDIIKMWNNLLNKSAARKGKLQHLHDYFADYDSLKKWIQDMNDTITATDYINIKLGDGEQLLIQRRIEIDSQQDAFEHFYQTGQKIIESNCFPSKIGLDIQRKINLLQKRIPLLERMLQKQHKILESAAKNRENERNMKVIRAKLT